jgi:hypothetical protein
MDRGDIRVVIDGRRFEPYDNYLRISGLRPGFHDLKIYRERNMGFFNIFGKRYEVVFNNSVMVRPNAEVMVMVDRFGRTTVNERRNNGWFGMNGGYDVRMNRDADVDNLKWDNRHDFDFDRMGNNGDYSFDRDGRFDRDDRDFRNYGNKTVMNDNEFGRTLFSIGNERFENNKVNMAMQVINANYFTSSQVKQMLQLFSFENNKLDLAKKAYGKTIDQRNYYLVNEVFSFNSSKDELARYIRDYR